MDPKLALPAVELAQRTHPGRDPEKQVNEDSCGYKETPFGHLCVLCDGMGGHQNGREASILAVQTILDTFATADVRSGSPGARGRELLKEAILAANARVCELGGASKQSRPGSTVVGLLLHAGGVEVAHVGDSRCYMVHSGQIFQVTKDHTVVQKMIDAELLTPAQAAVHPDANQIFRALGTSLELEVEVRAQTLPSAPGDSFLLCSDGLTDLVDPNEILRVVSAATPSSAVGELVDLANARGGHDNITVMLLRSREAGAVVREPAPTVAQTLFEGPAMPLLQPDGSGSVATATGSGPHAPASGPHSPRVPGPVVPMPVLPVAPLAPRAPRRSVSAVMVLGVMLAVVGFGAAGFAIFLLVNPNRNAKQVAPFALTGVPLSNPPPSHTLVPVAPEPPLTPLDAAPLPSLIPPRPLRHGHGS